MLNLFFPQPSEIYLRKSLKKVSRKFSLLGAGNPSRWTIRLCLSLFSVFILIPDISYSCPQFRDDIHRFTRQYLPNVKSSLIGGQVTQESACNPVAKSRVGALGLMQIMPGTAKDIEIRCNLPGFTPLNPVRAIQGGVCYDSIVRKIVLKVSDQSTIDSNMLRAYNGGAGWIIRENQFLYLPQPDRCRKFRSEANCNENLEYPVRIKKLQLRFLSWD